MLTEATQGERAGVDEISFGCPWCHRELKIPIWTTVDTTGPCPHCSRLLTFLVQRSEGVRAGSAGNSVDVSPQTPVPPADSNGAKRRFPWIAIILATVLLVLVTVTYYLSDRKSGASSATLVARFEMPGMKLSDANAAPYRVLNQFHYAKSLAERMEMVFNPIRYQPEMSGYFDRERYPQIPPREFVPAPSLKYSTASAAFLLGARDSQDGPPIVARFLRDRSNKLKLDWELYVQSSTDKLARFCSEPISGFHRYFVEVRRLENSKGRAVCVAISNFGSPKPTLRVALDQRSEIGLRIAGLLAPGESLPMAVELHWDDATTRIVISSIEPMLPRFGVLREPLNFLVDARSGQ
ncbi:MAG: hypothetical protein R3F19_27465 [Verrucomicrobiales bacterium]